MKLYTNMHRKLMELIPFAHGFVSLSHLKIPRSPSRYNNLPIDASPGTSQSSPALACATVVAAFGYRLVSCASHLGYQPVGGAGWELSPV